MNRNIEGEARLTPAEKACIDAYIQGASAKQIATASHRSPKTIHNLLLRGCAKLGIERRRDLLTYHHLFWYKAEEMSK